MTLLLAAALQLAGCSRLFFFPEHELRLNPDQVGLRYEDVDLVSADGVGLHGWFLPASREAAGTLVFLHGNAENISTHLGAVYWLPEEGFNVFLLDYRGFGRSRGKPNLDGVHRDAAAALRYVVSRKDVDPDRLVILGQSIGGAIAIHTAATIDIPVAAVVAESAFTGYREIVQEKMSEVWLTWPFQWMAFGMTSKYDPVTAVEAISSTPLLLIHGKQDNIIPVAHAYRLHAAARGDKQLWIVEDAGHIGAFQSRRSDYRRRFVRYLRRVLEDR